jgi:hypothetical protein
MDPEEEKDKSPEPDMTPGYVSVVSKQWESCYG